jgi:peptidoglycan hydrolase CwlO-like protein
MTRNAALTILAGALAMASGCEQSNDPATRNGGVQRNPGSATKTPAPSNSGTHTGNNTGAPSGTSGTTSGPSFMHQQMLTTWKSQIGDVQTRVQSLQTKIDSYQGTDKQQVQQDFQNLRQKADELNSRVQSFNVSDSGGFDTFRTDIESQMAQINDQLRSLNIKLDQAPQTDPSTTPSNTPDTPTMPDSTAPQNPR